MVYILVSLVLTPKITFLLHNRAKILILLEKFTFFKSLILHKIHNFKISLFTKLTFFKHQILGNFWIKSWFFAIVCFLKIPHPKPMCENRKSCIFLNQVYHHIWGTFRSHNLNTQMFSLCRNSSFITVRVCFKDLLFSTLQAFIVWKMVSTSFGTCVDVCAAVELICIKQL